jgi:DeoR family glycerol-3-phosphate regulon repressor
MRVSVQNRAPYTHRELALIETLRRLGGSARSSELARALDVSEETVRRTLKALADSGTVERVHGGAYLTGTQNDPSFFRRIAQHSGEKRSIAERVAGMVQDGTTLFLDVGSTTSFVAEELQRKSHLTVVTNSVGVAQALMGVNGNRVHLLGGEMQSDERGAFGHVTEQHACRFAFDLAILSADALSTRGGFLYLSSAEADLANVIAERSSRVLVALAHFKYGATAPYCGPDPRKINDMVTDLAPEGALASALEEWGIRTHLAT